MKNNNVKMGLDYIMRTLERNNRRKDDDKGGERGLLEGMDYRKGLIPGRG